LKQRAGRGEFRPISFRGENMKKEKKREEMGREKQN
jgi:hypothetical protein